MYILKHDTDEFIYETETNLQTQKTNMIKGNGGVIMNLGLTYTHYYI